MKKSLVLFIILSIPCSLWALSRPTSPKLPFLSKEQQMIQVLNRLTFGPRPQDFTYIQKTGIKPFIEEQLQPEKIDDSQCDQWLAQYPDLLESSWDLYQKYPPANVLIVNGIPQKNYNVNEEQKKEANQRVRTILKQMDAAKLTRILYSKRQLQEVMTDFWFNHFNVTFEKNRIKWLLPGYERDVIRANALGNFRDLLGAVAHSPTMLDYLDNVVSTVDPRYVSSADMGEYPMMAAMTKTQPNGKPKKNVGLNENYARELMELHTLGVDSGYTQQDVIEVARVLTGWSFDGPNILEKYPYNANPDDVFRFKFRAKMHDRGTKTILGQTFGPDQGELEGEAVLDMLCKQPATAHFIAFKLCRRFISDNPPENLVKNVATTFLKTNGDIRSCLRAIFYSKEFMDPHNYRAKIKTPLEFVASAIRVTNGQLTQPEKAAQTLNLMGENLYLCEPPTGYPDTAAAWVYSSALLDRLNFGLILLSNRPNSPASVDLLKLDTDLKSGNDGKRILNRLFKIFLKDQVSDNTRKVLMKKLDDPEVSHTLLDDKKKSFEAAQLGALVLGSPDFQRR
jgi:uncharacterized protein (DUF1800 family)